MDYFSECLTRFQLLPKNVREAYGGLEAFAATLEIEEAYNIKLSFLVILIAIGELNENDIEDYLVAKFKISSEIAKKIKDELVVKVLDPAFEKVFGLKPAVSFSAPKEVIINLFSERLIESMKADAETIKGLNVLIFKAFNDEEDLEEQVIEILYNNNEQLTTNSIIIDNRELAPTISNWLKDFIKLNGSEIFDELKMIEYLNSSPNAKKLNTPEKDLLRKLLKLYKNLVFFPESMDNKLIEDWEIIPVDKIKEDKKTNKVKVFQDVLADNQVTKKEAVKKQPVKEQAKEQIQDKIENTPLNDLEEMLTQYAPGSLEYKAIKQEMKRLKNKKIK
ncbi:hypothetical protein GX917_01920 [Candidatus Falkowbacteria bacterium]|jgi:uncharacterized Fe-S cluster-containing radical SAM superfamily protein|nr:hypothetical protein [Candidatus Falkowbacteria bacterium]